MIGLAILNYNDYKTTLKLVETISCFKSIDRIAVVDNKSTDESYEKLLLAASDKIRVHVTDYNGGYSYGNNFAADILIHDGCNILFFANPDVLFDECFIVTIANLIHENGIAAATGLMLDSKGQKQSTVLKNSRYIDDLLGCFFILKHFHSNTKKLKNNSGFVAVDQLSGSLFAIHADVFREIKGFDEGVFLYCEERIIGEKLKRKGYKMVVDTSVCFYHDHSQTINRSLNPINKMERLFESRLYFQKKYGSISKIKYDRLKIAMKIGINIRKIIWRIKQRWIKLF